MKGGWKVNKKKEKGLLAIGKILHLNEVRYLQAEWIDHLTNHVRASLFHSQTFSPLL